MTQTYMKRIWLPTIIITDNRYGIYDSRGNDTYIGAAVDNEMTHSAATNWLIKEALQLKKKIVEYVFNMNSFEKKVTEEV